MDSLIKTFYLRSDATGKIKFNAPDGETYTLDPLTAGNDWIYENEQNSGKPVIAFRKGNDSRDGEIVVSLEGAPSISATLLHHEDDTPRNYIYATDGGNPGIPEFDKHKRPCFRLRLQGHKGSPLLNYVGFRIMVVK